jgi:hypothetical protein
MRHEFVLAIGWLLVSICSASPEEKPAPLPQESFVGEWVIDTEATPKEATVVIPRFVVTNKDKDWSIKAWWDNGGGPGVGEVPLEKVTFSLLGDDRNSKARQYGFAAWELKGEGKAGMTIHLTLRSEKDKLVVETFTIIKDNKSGGENIHTLGKYKKK